MNHFLFLPVYLELSEIRVAISFLYTMQVIGLAEWLVEDQKHLEDLCLRFTGYRGATNDVGGNEAMFYDWMSTDT